MGIVECCANLRYGINCSIDTFGIYRIAWILSGNLIGWCYRFEVADIRMAIVINANKIHSAYRIIIFMGKRTKQAILMLNDPVVKKSKKQVSVS